MVLKSLAEKIQIGFVFLFLFGAMSSAFADETWTQASQLAKRGEHKKAYELLNKNHNLASPSVSMQIVVSAALWALRAGDEAAASRMAYTAVHKRLSWWRDYAQAADTTAVDISAGIEKTSANERLAMWIAGEAKSLRFAQNFDKFSSEERKKLKAEIKALYDALMQSDFDSEKVEAFYTRMMDAEDLVQKKVYTFQKNLFARYLFWSEEFDFKGGGEGIGHGLCVGGSLARANFFYEYALSACAGIGKAVVQFESGEIGHGRDALTTMFSLGALRKFSEGRAGIGIEAAAFGRQVDIGAPDITGTEKKFAVGFAPLLNLRLDGEKYRVEFHGGKLLGEPSALWALDFVWKF